ncbi:MAG: hypothetical protein KJI71_05820, partial [Patescibacteria group bacterium]|nr:hypothetical protein [Patescibacteria group bacterium]
MIQLSDKEKQLTKQALLEYKYTFSINSEEQRAITEISEAISRGEQFMIYPTVKEELLKPYSLWMTTQGKSKATYELYIILLKAITGDVEEYFAQPQTTNIKFFAYRSYLRFLAKKQKISRVELEDLLDSLQPRKVRGNNNKKKKFAIPKEEWS